MRSLTEEIKASLRQSVGSAEAHESPYRHWFVRNVFPQEVYEVLKDMPFPVADLGGVSGTREVHNADRVYFSGSNLDEFENCRAAAEAFQDDETVRLFDEAFGGTLKNSFVRIEYAQDTDGFWLKPHTDIGVKMFTMLIYMSDDPAPRRPRHRHLRRRELACRPLALPAELRDDLRSLEEDLARLREAADPGRAALAHRQLRDQRLAGARAARLSAGAGARQRGLRRCRRQLRRRPTSASSTMAR